MDALEGQHMENVTNAFSNSMPRFPTSLRVSGTKRRSSLRMSSVRTNTMFGFSDLAALCGPYHVPVIATDEETVARTSEAHSKIFFTFAPPFQEVTEYCIPAQATSQPLFA